MNFLTQEQAAQLKAGDVVDVFWFSPRAPKGDAVPTREYGGRTEYLETVVRGKTVTSAPYMSASDGWLVQLDYGFGAYCTSRMALVSQATTVK